MNKVPWLELIGLVCSSARLLCAGCDPAPCMYLICTGSPSGEVLEIEKLIVASPSQTAEYLHRCCLNDSERSSDAQKIPFHAMFQ